MAGRRKKYCIQLGEKNQQLKLGEENRVAFRREHIMVVGKKYCIQLGEKKIMKQNKTPRKKDDIIMYKTCR